MKIHRRKGFHSWLGLVIVLTLTVCQRPLALSAQLDQIRTITLRVAADTEFRSLPNWEHVVRETVEAVSNIYEKKYQIRFRIVEVVEWKGIGPPVEPGALAEELEKAVDVGIADVLVGLSGRRSATSHDGAAVAFGRTTVLMTESRYLGTGDQRYRSSSWREKMLSHELAHLFGAFHVLDAGSVMGEGPADRFDSQTERIIRLMRDFDFKAGVAAIDAGTKSRYTAIFDEGHKAGEINGLAHAYNNLGKALMAQGKGEAALEAFREATRIAPRFAMAHYNLGFGLDAQGRLEEALAAYRAAVTLELQYFQARTALAIALMKRGLLDEAISEFREVIRGRPQSFAAHWNLARALARRGRVDEAIAAYGDAVRLEPTNTALRHDLAKLASDTQRPELAVDQYREIVRINPRDARAHYYLGWTLGRQRKMDEAIAECREAVRIDPAFILAHGCIGRALAAKGQVDDAVREFKEALEIAPKNGQLRYDFATALYLGGRYREAWTEVGEAERLGYKVPERFIETLKQKMPDPR